MEPQPGAGGDRSGQVSFPGTAHPIRPIAADSLLHLNLVGLEEFPQGYPADAQEAGRLALFAPSLVDGVDQPLAFVRGPGRTGPPDAPGAAAP